MPDILVSKQGESDLQARHQENTNVSLRRSRQHTKTDQANQKNLGRDKTLPAHHRSVLLTDSNPYRLGCLFNPENLLFSQNDTDPNEYCQGVYGYLCSVKRFQYPGSGDQDTAGTGSL